MPRKQLHVPKAAAGTVDVAGCHRDEAASPGMRRASLKAEFFEQRHEPIHDAIRFEVRASIRADDRTHGLCSRGQALQSAPQVRVDGNPPPSALFCNDVPDVDRAGHAAWTMLKRMLRHVGSDDFGLFAGHGGILLRLRDVTGERRQWRGGALFAVVFAWGCRWPPWRQATQYKRATPLKPVERQALNILPRA